MFRASVRTGLIGVLRVWGRRVWIRALLGFEASGSREVRIGGMGSPGPPWASRGLQGPPGPFRGLQTHRLLDAIFGQKNSARPRTPKALNLGRG